MLQDLKALNGNVLVCSGLFIKSGCVQLNQSLNIWHVETRDTVPMKGYIAHWNYTARYNYFVSTDLPKYSFVGVYIPQPEQQKMFKILSSLDTYTQGMVRFSQEV